MYMPKLLSCIIIAFSTRAVRLSIIQSINQSINDDWSEILVLRYIHYVVSSLWLYISTKQTCQRIPHTSIMKQKKAKNTKFLVSTITTTRYCFCQLFIRERNIFSITNNQLKELKIKIYICINVSSFTKTCKKQPFQTHKNNLQHDLPCFLCQSLHLISHYPKTDVNPCTFVS